MKKKNLKTLMVAGMTSGMLLTQLPLQSADSNKKATNDSNKTNDNSFLARVAESGGNIAAELMTEDELLLQLNDEGIKLYQSLSPEGKQLAIETASAGCNGENSCKHLNACSTTKNTCMGKGECKGQGKCAFADKNMAVKVVADKMAEKRLDAQNKPNNKPAVPANRK